MSNAAKIAYHLQELRIAENAESPFHSMPDFGDNQRAILDIGCGIGQTFVAAKLRDRLLVGLDIDHDALSYGREHFPEILFVNGTAERLPFQDGRFDLVVSRVSLFYSDLPTALAEVRRVLKDGGGVWLTLHPLAMTLTQFREAIARRDPKAFLTRIYVLANGAYFHFLGRNFRFPLTGKCESFQTEKSMRRALDAAGFEAVTLARNGKQFTVTAQARNRPVT